MDPNLFLQRNGMIGWKRGKRRLPGLLLLSLYRERGLRSEPLFGSCRDSTFRVYLPRQEVATEFSQFSLPQQAIEAVVSPFSLPRQEIEGELVVGAESGAATPLCFSPAGSPPAKASKRTTDALSDDGMTSPRSPSPRPHRHHRLGQVLEMVCSLPSRQAVGVARVCFLEDGIPRRR